MVEVYYYIPAGEADSVVECGLKLSVWADREVLIDGEPKKCLSALLNPRDDMNRYRSDAYRCVKLEVREKYCHVGDSSLYRIGAGHPGVMELYRRSIVPVSDYAFGTYRLPECLISTTVVGDQISALNKGLTSPILFTSSEELYINNMLEALREEYEDFNDAILYYFYSKLSENGKLNKIEDKDSGMAVFTGAQEEKCITIRIPGLERHKL